MPSYKKSKSNKYNLAGGGKQGGVKPQHRVKPGGKNTCDFGTTGSRAQAPGSGASHNASARSTTAGHKTLAMGLEYSRSGMGYYHHPYAHATPQVYGGGGKKRRMSY